MTWEQWASSADPDTMLALARGRISERKVRLFGVACCRRAWSLLEDVRSRRAVEAAERFADGRATRSHLAKAWGAVRRGTRGAALALCVSHRLIDTARQAWWHAVLLLADASRSPRLRAETARAEQDVLCALLRDIANNPFRRPAVAPAWLAWEGGLVVKMARAVYEGRRFEDLPVLADALEDAGCTDEAILAHCRGPGPHVRGCWAVDLLRSLD